MEESELTEFKDKFEEEGIKTEHLIQMTENYLKEMMKELGMKKLGDRWKLLRNLRPLKNLFMAEVQNVQEEIKENYVIQDTQEETLSEITHEETHDETENEETFTENTLAKTIDETDNVETFTPEDKEETPVKKTHREAPQDNCLPVCRELRKSSNAGQMQILLHRSKSKLPRQ